MLLENYVRVFLVRRWGLFDIPVKSATSPQCNTVSPGINFINGELYVGKNDV